MIETAESERKVKMINNISAELARIIGYKERLTRLSELAVPDWGDWCLIDMMDDSGKIERVALMHKDKDKVKELQKINQKFGLLKKGLIWNAIETGEPQIVENFEKVLKQDTGADKEHTERLIRLGIGPVVVMVLEGRGKKFGTITLMKDAGSDPYDKVELEFIRILTSQIGIMIDNSFLLAKANEELVKQKKARRELEDSEGALKLALSAGRMGVWDWEIGTGKLRLSSESEDLYGINKEKFRGTLEEVIARIYEEDKSRVLANIKQAVQDRSRYLCEYRVVRREGGIKWVMAVGNVECDKNDIPIRLRGVVSDVTDRKVAEISLKQNERKFKLIFENAMDTIMIADNHGRIMDINPAGVKLWGKSAEEMMKLRLSDLVTEHRDEIKDKWKGLSEMGSQIGEITVKNSSSVTKTLEYAATANILPYQDLFIFRDITDRVIEEKRREHFLSIASHELRSPLASIKAFNYLVKKLPGVKDDKKSSEYLAKIDDKVDAVARLISDLLDVTRIRQGKLEMVPEEFDFDAFVREMLNELKMTIKTHRIFKSGKTGKQIIADKKKIGQVINNLIRNAVKYSPNGNRVEVKLKGDNEGVMMSIRDFGMGIDKIDKNKVFELYYRGTDERKEGIRGLGVGLYISEQIIRQHKGKIWVESQKNKGSTFYFKIPLKYE